MPRHWVEPYVFASLFAASMILSWVLVAWIPRRVSRSDRATQRSLVAFAGVLALLAGAGALFGELTSAPKPSPFEPDPLYVAVRDQRAGPFAHVLAEIRAPLRAGLLAPSDISIERRPIVPLESYLAGVEPGRRKHWNVVFVVVESLRADQLRA